jgi:hypothetical protein
MSFFDSKQEVINIELTQLGKELFSKGLFEPKYYAFFDDDIIYDINYCGLTESQNETETRILEQSIYNKPIYNFSDREKNIKSLNSKLQATIDYKKSLGTVDSTNNYAPAWNIEVLNGPKITRAYNTSSYPDIVQIDLSSSQINITGSGISLDISTDYILLEIEEKNIISKKENFELELYEVLDTTDSSGTKQLLHLPFGQKTIYIKDGLLLDQPIYPPEVAENNDELAEYYFSISADKEISTTTINNVRKSNKKLYTK